MELYINDLLVDINDRIAFPLTYSISDIKDVSARKGNNSKTITLPGTQRNYSMMLSVFQLALTDSIGASTGALSFDPSIKATARYYHNGLLEFNGICQLQDCTLENGIWSFDIVLISDTIDYMTRLQNIKVNELDWSMYNHPLIYDVIYNSWTGYIRLSTGSDVPNKTGANWDGFGYYYGLIDYGYDRPAPDVWECEHIPPQMFVYEILQKAFEYCGISWNSAFLESQKFKKLLLAYAGGDLPTIDQTQADNDSSFTQELNNGSGFILQGSRDEIGRDENFSVVYFGGPVFIDAYDCNTVTDSLFQVQTTSPLLWVSQGNAVYDVNYVGTHNMELVFNLQGISAVTLSGVVDVKLIIYKNGSVIAEDNVYSINLISYSPTITTVGFDTFATINLSTAFDYTRAVDIDFNDTLTFGVKIQFNSITADTVGLTALGSFEFTVESDTADLNIRKQIQSLTTGGTVNIASFLPDMDCATFFKGFITAFNLYVKPSVEDATILEIEPLSDFYNGTDTALVWSDKVDYSKKLSVKPTINFAPKSYLMKFEQDDDYFNTKYINDVDSQYGAFVVDSQSDFATNKTELKLPFAQKLLVNIPFDETTFTDIIVPRSFQVKFEEDGSSSVVKKKGKPFIVQLGGYENANWTLIDEDDVAHAFTTYPYVGHLDSLSSPSFDFNWGIPNFVYWVTTQYTTSNLYAYHEKFIKEIISRFGKQLSCYVYLDSTDINKLDFKNLINIGGVVYRLQKISDYQSGANQTTLIELIRIIEGENIQSSNVIPPYNPFEKQARITEDGIGRLTEEDETRDLN